MTSCSEPRQVTRSRAVLVLPDKGTSATTMQDASMPSSILAHVPTLVVVSPAHIENTIDSTLVVDTSTSMTESPALAPESIDDVMSTSPIGASSQGTDVVGVRTP
ncbi:hypothetical protein V6N11_054512 [Hibiscus sabdariffa]|uniref:Uncharacterized protein n=1 Tax=Hibiscus sabdariffa TaxID=183260 RepID=A0ABR2S4Z2_9ROSI